MLKITITGDLEKYLEAVHEEATRFSNEVPEEERRVKQWQWSDTAMAVLIQGASTLPQTEKLDATYEPLHQAYVENKPSAKYIAVTREA